MASEFDEFCAAYNDAVYPGLDESDHRRGMAAALRRMREQAEISSHPDSLAVTAQIDELLRQSGEGEAGQ